MFWNKKIEKIVSFEQFEEMRIKLKSLEQELLMQETAIRSIRTRLGKHIIETEEEEEEEEETSEETEEDEKMGGKRPPKRINTNSPVFM
ncbi:MAG: hypothetical protein AAB789_01955 [Patescibacteria group bacterium]